MNKDRCSAFTIYSTEDLDDAKQFASNNETDWEECGEYRYAFIWQLELGFYKVLRLVAVYSAENEVNDWVDFYIEEKKRYSTYSF